MSYFRVMNGKGEVAEFDNADTAAYFYCLSRACAECPMRGYGDQKMRCIVKTPAPDDSKELANERDPDGFQINPSTAAPTPDSATAHDPVNHPAHYTAGGIECIDAIAAALTCQKDPMQAWLTGQVLKYLWRWPLKNGLEDLKKAQFYLSRLIEKLEGAGA